MQPPSNQVPPEVIYWTDLILGPKGLAVMLLVILYGVIRREPWWVPGHIYRRTEQKLDALQELVTANTVLVAQSMKGQDARDARDARREQDSSAARS